jgi:uncharacterized protein (TIGR03435 family)
VASMRALIAMACCLPSFASVFAQATSARTEFEVASIKRNLLGSRPWLAPPAGGRFTATNIPLKLLIRLGWPQRIVGGPAWVFTDGYDITAKEPERTVNDDEFSVMMQNLLKDRFGLRVHTESRATRVYVLTPDKSGLKLPDAKPEPCFYGSKTPHAGAQEGCGGMNVTA